MHQLHRWMRRGRVGFTSPQLRYQKYVVDRWHSQTIYGFYRSWEASEVPMTFSNLLPCRDMTLNETCREAEGQGQGAWILRALSLKVYGHRKERDKTLFLVKK